MSKISHETKKSKKTSGWFRRNIPKVILILVATVVLSVISKMPKRDDDTPASEPAPVNVKVMDVTAESEFADTFELPAVIEPNKIVTISAEIDGRIEDIPVEEGYKVKTGDLLIKLNTDLILPQLEMAQAQLKRDEIEYQRMVNLVENEATAKSDLDNAMTSLAISRAQLDEIKARLERSSIIASTNGVLNKILVEEGEYIQPGMPVAEIVDNESVKVVVEVSERDISFFTTGKEAEVYTEYRGMKKVLTGTITFISELADQLTHSTRVEITLPNKEKYMRSGQIVRVAMTRQILNDVILIPLSAVIPMENGYAVYVVNSNEAKRRDVVIDIIKGENVLIESGLMPGDRLIISGHRFVVPDQQVTVVPENQ
jgi:RND family efflux transporter MFP subunit